ncbi:MAG TPA: RHS repeat-associated core domain-containing protein, partial [Kofleriaceae bacterium]
MGALLAAQPAWAQLSLPPAGPSGGGFAGANSGGYGASVPLDFPAAHGGLPVPVQITYSEHGVGAAGRGWDVPLSYIRDDTTIVRRRPVGTANVAPAPREQVSLTLSGRSTDLILAGTVNTNTVTVSTWIARNDDVQLRVQHTVDTNANTETWVAYDGQGRTYTFAAISGTGIWLLQDITAIGGGKVHLEYDITTPTISGNVAIAIDLTRVSYNPSPADATCYKNAVKLNYDAVVNPPLSISLIGTKLLVRQHKLRPTQSGSAVDILAKESCGASDVRLRHYEFTYASDGDTGQPRLQEVRVFGRDGTAEANASASIPVAKFSYGTAITGGQLNYGAVVPRDSASSQGIDLGWAIQNIAPPVPGVGDGMQAVRLLVDVTGDGRPDIVEFPPVDGKLLVYPNYSTANAFGFRSSRALWDGTLSSRPPDMKTFEQRSSGSTTIAYNRAWRRAIDVNGDGRVDLIDAVEQPGHWVIYLNTPDATDPSIVHWQRRSIPTATLSQQLASRGMTESGRLPLSRTAIGPRGQIASCYVCTSEGQWEEMPAGSHCGEPSFPPVVDDSYTEWDLRDVNGDGYPDVVFNSSRIDVSHHIVEDGRVGHSCTRATINNTVFVTTEYSVGPTAGGGNAIDTMFNVLGTHLIDGDLDVFSSPVVLRSGDPCGLEHWITDSDTTQHMECGIADVNGDGVLDRISGTAVFLGTASVDGSGSFSSAAMMTLPGPLASETNDRVTACANGGSTFTEQHKARLIDLTGDGIPDYVTSTSSGTGWALSVGTGVGFASAKPIATGFVLATNSDSCGAFTTISSAGIVDIDGDGKPEVFNSQGQLLAITGSDGLAGAPSAGRLVAIDNEFGAKTNIHYRSIKGDSGSMHQVPFAEIVVDSVDTSATAGFGSGLGATRYAYGGAELVFYPAADRFAFPGYRRTIMLQTPEAQPDGFGAVVVSDSYAPVSAVDPYGIGGGATVDPTQRYMLLRRIGRPRDVTVLSGNFGAAALANPSQLLGIDVTSDGKRIGAAHYEWSARLFGATSVPPDPNDPKVCIEAIYPYDYAASTTFVSGHDHFDPCIAHGFAFSSSVQTWRGDPGAAPPSTNNVETRSEVLTIDDLGRVVSVKNSNDLHRSDDDLCVNLVYATPTDPNVRVLSAISERNVSNCGSVFYTRDLYSYDGLASKVSAGRMTLHQGSRRDENGKVLNTFTDFTARYDANGNPTQITTSRDSAQRVLTIGYDPFLLAPTSLQLSATSLPTTLVSVVRDPLTLQALSTTDANSTTRSARFDGFDRQTMSTITPPGGTEGALSVVRYDGFTVGATQRTIVQKTFQTAVAPGTAASAPGRTSTVFLDELGRAYKTQVDLGGDYSDPTLVSQRSFDSLGRVVFEADPFPVSQGFTTAYGTTQFFNWDGTPLCSVRGNGRQTSIPGSVDANHVVHPATDESQQLYPTCVQRDFESNTEVVTVRDASSYLAGSPQAGVAKSSYRTATGRVIKRSTWNGQTKLEHATLSYDGLGRLNGMTRFQDANGEAKPVTWSWHYDSLGQLIELDEPDSVPRYHRYSTWGELVETSWLPSAPRSSNPPATALGTPPAANVGRHVIAQYDALGRVTHREEQQDGVTDAQTVNDYFYDTGVNITGQVTPTYTRGRLTQASWPTGSVSLSYDAAGDVNARVFLDPSGRTHVEKRTFNDDGTLQLLDLFPPDAPGAQEESVYHYDSAGHGDSVVYKTGDHLQNSQTLYTASQGIDSFGRVRQAHYGVTSYTADYADVGRRLLNQVTVASMVGSRQIAFQGFDPMGRERSRTETRNNTDTSTTTHTYDALGRLATSVKTGGTTPGFNQQFAYDPLGNLLSQTDTSGAPGAINTTLTYLGSDHDSDRICRISYGTDTGTTCNVTYDELGSIASMATPNGTRQFDYFLDGSVKTIQDDRLKGDFRYDAFGEVQELDLDVKTGTAPVGTDTRHDRHYGDLFTWHDEPTGSVLLRKIPGPDGFLATRHGAGGPWVFSFGEERGTRFTTDDGGNFVQDVNYQPFGKPTPTSTGAQPGSALYSNEQWNYGDYLAAFGISKLGARLYDPSIGRFLSRDPLLIPCTAATTNPYSFADNDPINASDPSGLMIDTGSQLEPPNSCFGGLATCSIEQSKGGGGSGGGGGGGGLPLPDQYPVPLPQDP